MFDPDAPLSDETLATIDAIRTARRNVIESIESGVRTFAQVMSDVRQDSRASSVYALKVLEKVPGVGKVRARRALDEVGRDYFVRLSELTSDDVDSLCATLGIPSR